MRTRTVQWSALMGLGRLVDVALQAAQRGLGAGEGCGAKAFRVLGEWAMRPDMRAHSTPWCRCAVSASSGCVGTGRSWEQQRSGHMGERASQHGGQCFSVPACWRTTPTGGNWGATEWLWVGNL